MLLSTVCWAITGHVAVVAARCSPSHCSCVAPSIVLVASAVSEYVNLGGEKNEIGLACQEDTLWLYLNGKLFRKLDVSRFGLQEGRLGLAAASFENLPVTAAFDWVRVSEP